MRRTINKLIFTSIILTAIYLICAFTASTFNPSDWMLFNNEIKRDVRWMEAVRAVMAIIFFIVLLFVVFIDEMDNLLDGKLT